MSVSHLVSVYGQPTPQTEPIMGREDDMKLNSAGGYVFPVDDWTQLNRFLILGSEGGSYYADERKLTRENAKVVDRVLKKDPARAIQCIAEISEEGRSHKNDTCTFAFAMAIVAAKQNKDLWPYLRQNLRKVIRTASHLFMLMVFVSSMRGQTGRGFRSLIGSWYAADAKEVAFQIVKYRMRNGWSHQDVFNLAHPKPATQDHQDLFQWIITGVKPRPSDAHTLWSEPLKIVEGFCALQDATSPLKVAELLEKYKSLSWEMIPNELRSDVIWREITRRMPVNALIRQLSNLTRRKILADMGDMTSEVVTKLTNPDAKWWKVHPLQVLTAHKSYSRGSSNGNRYGRDVTWTPVGEIVDALDNAFQLSFRGLRQIDSRLYIAVDVSGSMKMHNLGGMEEMTPCEASAAMAMVLSRIAPRSIVRAFNTQMTDLPIKGESLRSVVSTMSEAWLGGGTDCALPMLDAAERNIPVDCFVILTDGETWHGNIHASEALKMYRKKTGINARCIMASMVSNAFSIADPDDAGMLDIVGFDATCGPVIADFAEKGM